MIDVEQLIREFAPKIDQSPIKRTLLTNFLNFWIAKHKFTAFEKEHPNVKNLELIEQALQYLNITYSYRNRDRENIPEHGRLVVVANHPLGCMDAFAIVDSISQIRRDIKIVTNAILSQIKPLEDMFLPVNNMSGKTPDGDINAIEAHLNNEGVVIIFPAGEVSRVQKKGVLDGRWHTGFLRMATETQSPILPIHVDAKNSWLFYLAAGVSDDLAMSLLPREIFKGMNKNFVLSIGEKIPYHIYKDLDLPLKEKALLFKKHLYAIGKGKKGTIKTESGIALPESRTAIKKELNTTELIGQTHDNKDIYLYRFKYDSAVMREIGRLREVAFRAVGEGSGKRRDIDHYDEHYLHIVLWDNTELEIAGAYRLLPTKNAITTKGLESLYTSTLFNYDASMHPYLNEGLELGRSFVQPKYWGKRSLDYLWQGIGAFLSKNPQCRYLFGPVSISQNMPEVAKQMMIYFYSLYYGSTDKCALHKQPYHIPDDVITDLKSLFTGDDIKADFKQLKSIMNNMGSSIPTLYKQYADLCEPGGVQFLDFGIDPDFADCVDGLVLVDSHAIKAKKRARYIESHSLVKDDVGEL